VAAFRRLPDVAKNESNPKDPTTVAKRLEKNVRLSA
jgi:hypothetical protein